MQTVKVTPTVEDIQFEPETKCLQPGCLKSFRTSSNLEMHLKKHHNIDQVSISAHTRLYHESLRFSHILFCAFLDAGTIGSLIVLDFPPLLGPYLDFPPKLNFGPPRF